MQFGDRIRARARELGLSDSEVGRRIDVDPSRVGRYIRGVNEPDLSTLVRLCDALALTPNDLLLPKDSNPDSDRTRQLALVADVCAGLPDEDVEIVMKLAVALKEKGAAR
jgi:transcriptional regulator with XRE-family HTH domain